MVNNEIARTTRGGVFMRCKTGVVWTGPPARPSDLSVLIRRTQTGNLGPGEPESNSANNNSGISNDVGIVALYETAVAIVHSANLVGSESVECRDPNSSRS